MFPSSSNAPEGRNPLNIAVHIDWSRLLLAAALASGVAFAAWRFKALTGTGAVAAGLVGAVTVTGAGWLAGLLMVAFFVSSSLLSRIGKQPARRLASQRGSRRDAVQVLANGGLAGSLAFVALLDPGLLNLALAGIAGALAAATADTWATEIGRRARGQPRKITTGEFVTPGISGGVTPLGTGAAFAGAAFIALLAQVVAPLFADGTNFITGWSGFLTITLAGFGGALADSFAGAAIQARYFCDACQTVTESPRHGCGQPASLVAGYPRVSNDVVNLIATLSGATIALLVAFFAS